MADAVERLVNLAIAIASARAPVSAAHLRAQVAGYPSGQDDTAFQRMFERDKEDLRTAGLVIEVDRSSGLESYRLDEKATYAQELDLTPEEATLIRAAGAAMLADPSFPRPADLRCALSKLTAAAESAPVPLTGVTPVSALTADEAPDTQGAVASALADAAASRKVVTMTYDSPAGTKRPREVEPYGLYARDGRWYLVARDRAADAVRVFAVARMSDVAPETRRPKDPDFDLPDGFDVRAWMALPFQFGGPRTEAVLRLSGAAALRAEALAAGQGRLEARGDGAIAWTVPVADARALAVWAIENGPGIAVEAPEEARRLLTDGLARVVGAHAG